MKAPIDFYVDGEKMDVVRYKITTDLRYFPNERTAELTGRIHPQHPALQTIKCFVHETNLAPDGTLIMSLKTSKPQYEEFMAAFRGVKPVLESSEIVKTSE